MDDLVTEIRELEEKHDLSAVGINAVVALRLSKAIERLNELFKQLLED